MPSTGDSETPGQKRRGSEDGGVSPSFMRKGKARAKTHEGAGSYGDQDEREERLQNIVKQFLEGGGSFGKDNEVARGRKASVIALAAARTRQAMAGIDRPSGEEDEGGASLGMQLAGRMAADAARQQAHGKSLLARACAYSLRCMPVFRADHPAVRAWDLFILLLTIYIALALPVFVGWRETLGHDLHEQLKALHLIIDIAFLVDVLISMRRGYWQVRCRASHTRLSPHDPFQRRAT